MSAATRLQDVPRVRPTRALPEARRAAQSPVRPPLEARARAKVIGNPPQ